jgi:hypothetical protein
MSGSSGAGRCRRPWSEITRWVATVTEFPEFAATVDEALLEELGAGDG